MTRVASTAAGVPPPQLKAVHAWPVSNWNRLATQLRQHVADLSFRFAGQWQPRHVRIDVPFALASQAPAQHAVLIGWLDEQGLTYQIFGSTRADVRVEIVGPGTANS